MAFFKPTFKYAQTASGKYIFYPEEIILKKIDQFSFRVEIISGKVDALRPKFCISFCQQKMGGDQISAEEKHHKDRSCYMENCKGEK